MAPRSTSSIHSTISTKPCRTVSAWDAAATPSRVRRGPNARPFRTATTSSSASRRAEPQKGNRRALAGPGDVSPCRRAAARAPRAKSADRGLLGRRGALLGGVAQHVAAAPHRLDVALAAGGGLQLMAELADEDVDDLQFRLVHAAVEMVEEHLLGQCRALAQRQQLEDAVLLAGQAERLALDLDDAGVWGDRQLAGLDDRVGMALGAAHDRLDAGDQLALVERLGQVVVGPEAEALDFVVEFGKSRKNQDRRVDAGRAQPAQDLVTIDVWQHDIEKNDVVVVKLADLEAIFPQVGRI